LRFVHQSARPIALGAYTGTFSLHKNVEASSARKEASQGPTAPKASPRRRGFPSFFKNTSSRSPSQFSDASDPIF
jgi:hypothetical protein